MRIGSAIACIAVGAILTFAVTFSVSGLDLTAAGVVLMLAGTLWLCLETSLFAPQRRTIDSAGHSPAPAPYDTAVRRPTAEGR
ncbi:DUF6458 family protein [Kineococcus glutinatus]|uniref:DUF6458 domain-containing protein n=1 Tax=Kineococcus glutinatus TaxID=1070872 RepID=A0ABP9IBW2_9ACTN